MPEYRVVTYSGMYAHLPIIIQQVEKEINLIIQSGRGMLLGGISICSYGECTITVSQAILI
jgi:hypothetical protein